jgi:hypothetical protein
MNPLNQTHMKKNKFTIISAAFFIGAIFGISLFAVLSFSKPTAPPLPNQPLDIIDTLAAKKLFYNYYNSTGPIPTTFKGFMVDRLQLEAMNNLVNYDRTLTGFRLYMGMTDSGERVGIVVGVNDRLSDAPGRIYQTASVNSGPCPFICDETSPITNTRD